MPEPTAAEVEKARRLVEYYSSSAGERLTSPIARDTLASGLIAGIAQALAAEARAAVEDWITGHPVGAVMAERDRLRDAERESLVEIERLTAARDHYRVGYTTLRAEADARPRGAGEPMDHAARAAEPHPAP